MKKTAIILLAFLLSAAHAVLAETPIQDPNPRIRLATNHGDIVVVLDRKKAPKTVDNFLKYVQSGFYDGTIFHRVIRGFMVQGGGLTVDMEKKPTREPVRNEADNGLKNTRGSIAMARTNDPHSATAQFFINTVDNSFLDHRSKSGRGWGYCVFGEVVEGMKVVDKIENVHTTSKLGRRDIPILPVKLKKAEAVQQK